ncbi:MAG: hypothetical protein JSW27_24265 [Phycisphaerales bacterium]|nr:MAG: hypothetical protein JSW27_24265 [Phycisphaerales bacterium]
MPTKKQLNQHICKLVQGERPEILVNFSEEELKDYLRHLQASGVEETLVACAK